MSYYYTVVVHYTHSNITFGTCLSVVRSREQKGLSREEGRNASNSIASIYRKLGSSTKEKANYAAAVVKGPNPQKVALIYYFATVLPKHCFCEMVIVGRTDKKIGFRLKPQM